MVKTRIFTAVLILPLFLAALFYLPAILWGALLLILTVIGAQEWCKLAKFSVKNTTLYLIMTTLLGGELLFLLSEAVVIDPYSTSIIAVYIFSFIFWIFGVPFLLKTGYVLKNPLLLMLIGWLVLLPTCLALYQLRAISPYILLGFMTAVWVSDTAAYFAGRSFGRHKLAVAISPGKTWEGVIGALVAVSIYALVWNFLSEEKFLALLLVPLLLVLVVLGIIGDLFESQIKRQAGVKDSGNLLPGHGGILDRIDALTSTLPIAMLAILVYYSN